VFDINRAPWIGFSAPALSANGFRRAQKPLRPCRRLQPSLFLARPSILTAAEELGYDGTLAAILKIYRMHPASPFRRLSRSSRGSYGAYMNGIARAHGHHRVADLTGADMMNFADSWAAPIGIFGERLTGAQCSKQVLRNSLKFAAALGLKSCAALVQDLPLPKWSR
jgi:hypothetical protein